jgi:hypothetical protein
VELDALRPGNGCELRSHADFWIRHRATGRVLADVQKLLQARFPPSQAGHILAHGTRADEVDVDDRQGACTDHPHLRTLNAADVSQLSTLVIPAAMCWST